MHRPPPPVREVSSGDVTLPWKTAIEPESLVSGKNARRSIPCRHGLEVVTIGSQGHTDAVGAERTVQSKTQSDDNF